MSFLWPEGEKRIRTGLEKEGEMTNRAQQQQGLCFPNLFSRSAIAINAHGAGPIAPASTIPRSTKTDKKLVRSS
jgi:hypothetical protein